MKFKINEWNPTQSQMISWVGCFDNAAEAYSAIEYFGSVEEYHDQETVPEGEADGPAAV